MGSSKSPRRTFYWSSIETIALDCLVFEKIAFLYGFGWQTDRQTDSPSVKIVSGDLINYITHHAVNHWTVGKAFT